MLTFCPTTSYITNGKNTALVSWAKKTLIIREVPLKASIINFAFCVRKNDPCHNKYIERTFTVHLLSFAKHLSSIFLKTCMRNWLEHWQKENE